MVAFIPLAFVRVKSWISWPSAVLPKEAEVGMVEAVVPVAAESAGAVVVVAAVSWLVVGLESQLASSSVAPKPVAKSAKRGEMSMKKGVNSLGGWLGSGLTWYWVHVAGARSW